MADTQGQADIRGVDMNRFVASFTDEDTVLKSMCVVADATSRDIVYFQKSAGYVSPATTTGVTYNLAANTSQFAIAPVAHQTWTKQTSKIRTYKVESETISLSDEKDTDVDILMTMVRDLLVGVASQVDVRIKNVGTESLTPSNILSTAATGTGWDDTTNGDPILDILTGMRKIRQNGYDPRGAILYMNSIEHQHLMHYLISTKGSSIPNFSSDKVVSAAIQEVLSCNVVVSENMDTDYVWMFLNKKTMMWKNFTSLSAEVEYFPSRGKKVHVMEEGEALLVHPKSSHLTTDTIT